MSKLLQPDPREMSRPVGGLPQHHITGGPRRPLPPNHVLVPHSSLLYNSAMAAEGLTHQIWVGLFLEHGSLMRTQAPSVPHITRK